GDDRPPFDPTLLDPPPAPWGPDPVPPAPYDGPSADPATPGYPTSRSRRTRVPGWAKVLVAFVVPLFAIAVAGFVIHVPYRTLSPGAAVSLTDLVRVKGARTYPQGRGDI